MSVFFICIFCQVNRSANVFRVKSSFHSLMISKVQQITVANVLHLDYLGTAYSWFSHGVTAAISVALNNGQHVSVPTIPLGIEL